LVARAIKGLMSLDEAIISGLDDTAVVVDQVVLTDAAVTLEGWRRRADGWERTSSDRSCGLVCLDQVELFPVTHLPHGVDLATALRWPRAQVLVGLLDFGVEEDDLPVLLLPLPFLTHFALGGGGCDGIPRRRRCAHPSPGGRVAKGDLAVGLMMELPALVEREGISDGGGGTEGAIRVGLHDTTLVVDEVILIHALTHGGRRRKTEG
jgi:hypothetical protein